MPHAMPPAVTVSTQHAEALEGFAFTADDLARAAGMSADWVLDRVDAGVLQVDASSGAWRFDSLTLLRARRVAKLEADFDADPQLAALAADLMEEIARLRREIGTLTAVR